MPRYLEIDVTLKALKPAVKRRFLLPDDATLRDLYAALTDAFGWSGQRAFEVYRAEPGEAPLVAEGRGPEPGGVALADLLTAAGRSVVVVYDPDAWWEHVVTLKRSRDVPAEFSRRLTGARGAAPPEASGGLAGYQAWLAGQGEVPALDLDDLRSTFDA
jgi:hypothetical protein